MGEQMTLLEICIIIMAVANTISFVFQVLTWRNERRNEREYWERMDKERADANGMA
jgi:hypothetical protein